MARLTSGFYGGQVVGSRAVLIGVMQKSRFMVLLLVITLAALVAAWFWALNPLLTMLAYLHPPNWTEADLVRHIWHFRLVQPEWVSSPPNYDYLKWVEAETLARLSVVFVGWLVSVTLVIRKYLRNHRIAAINASPAQVPNPI
jgi:hypothetical protein